MIAGVPISGGGTCSTRPRLPRWPPGSANRRAIRIATGSARYPLPDRLPLSPAQTFIDRTVTAPAHYNIPFTLRVRGAFDHTALRRAVADVLERHRPLRTIYPDTPAGPYQHLLADAVPDPRRRRNIRAVLTAGFDVRTHPPLRIRVFEFGPDDHMIACTFHHIGVDGWSLAPLARDLVLAYSARADDSAPQWQDLPVQYADYTLWRRAVLGQRG